MFVTLRLTCVLDHSEAITQSFLVDPDIGQIDEHVKSVGRSASKGFRVGGTQDRDLAVLSAGLDDLLGSFLKEAVVEPTWNAE